MADQQRWFKLWYSALSDDHLQDLPPAIRWAWVAFGAYTKVHGNGGVVEISATNAVLAAQMGVALDALKLTIQKFPHMRVEECENRHGSFCVTWHNWTKYQRDSTQAERASASRSKRRGEEIKKRRDKKPPPVPPPTLIPETNGNGHVRPVFTIPTRIQEAIGRAPRLGAVPKIRTTDYWQAQLRANPGVDFAHELLRAEAYLTAHPEKHYSRLEGFLHNWLGRADRPPQEVEA